MNVFETDYECKACHGTGLYMGMAEKNGAAVVCCTCKGTGKAHFKFEYEVFTIRKQRTDVQRVYRTNPGIFVDGVGSVPGGVTISEWEHDSDSVNVPGAEMRLFTCPAWWYQTADYRLKPSWDDTERCCAWGGTFTSCKFFSMKAGCWDKWDREHAVKKEVASGNTQ